MIFSTDSVFSNQNLPGKLFPMMNRLLEDEAIKTRLFVVKSYKKMFDLYKRDFPAHLILGISTSELGTFVYTHAAISTPGNNISWG